MIITEEKKITLKIELCDEDKESIGKTFLLLDIIDNVIQRQSNFKNITDFINKNYVNFLTFLNDLEDDIDNVVCELENYLNEE